METGPILTLMLDSTDINQHELETFDDFVNLFETYEDDDTVESPFKYLVNNCEYVEPCQFKNVIPENSNMISFFHLNCRGLSSNWEHFIELINSLHTNTFQFDIIGVSECYKHENDIRIHINGYHEILSRNRNEGRKGGVGLFIKNNIQFKVREDISVFIPHVFESLFVEIELDSNKKQIVGIVYRPNTPPLADLDIFTDNMVEIMEIINRCNKHAVIMGDMNIDIMKYGSHEKTNVYVDSLFSNGFVPTITKPTRIGNTSATLIDHIYSNNVAANMKSGIVITDVADHYGIYHMVLNKSSITAAEPIEIRKFNNRNTQKFLGLLSECDFSEAILLDSVDASYDAFLCKYRSIFEESFPLTKAYTSGKRLHEPWYTPELAISSKQRITLFKRKQKNPTEDNIARYKAFNNDYNKQRRIAKSTYYNELINKYKSDAKKTWSLLNQALGKNRHRTSPSSIFFNDILSSNGKSIANNFNKEFANAGEFVAKNIPASRNTFEQYMPTPVSNSIFLDPVSVCDIKLIIDKMKPKVSTGFDDISCKLLKYSSPFILEPLTHIVNLSLYTGIVPSQMKLAKVVPIYKKGDQKSSNNYRPVSILPAFSKILEKAMYIKVMKYLDKHNVLYSHQYGFRPKHSTIHPIIHFMDHCAKARNKPISEITLALFCDLSKAFDVINHDIMLHKLSVYGIRGAALNWFKSYLSERKQYVRYNGYDSDYSLISHGVPQGSILGPLLFLIYVNDICINRNLNILSFADDTTLYMSSNSVHTLYDEANFNINCLYEWFCCNKLYLNAAKTKYIIISPPNTKFVTSNYSIKISGKEIDRIGNNMLEKSFKFLGIFIDENLSWKHHIAHVNSKLSQSLFGLRQVKNILPRGCLVNLYHALIQPYLSYGLILWGSAKPQYLKKTIILQKRALRIVNKSSANSHTEPLFKKYSILKLTDLFEFQILLFMYDYINNNLPSSFCGMFRVNKDVNTTYRTRQSNLYSLPLCRSNFVSKMLFRKAPETWNAWYQQIQPNISRRLFKTLTSRYMTEKYASQITCTYSRCHDCLLSRPLN